MSELVNYIKQISVNANEATKPLTIHNGVVTSEKPLKILIDQKLELEESYFELTNAVKDHYVDISVSHVTEYTNIDHKHDVKGSTKGADSPPHTHDIDITSQKNNEDITHLHAYKGKKKILVHNGLKNGEKVILLRYNQGQKFLVIDRVSDHIVEGQWT